MISQAFLTGFFSGGSLIVAIGAQNAFVLQQGLKRTYPMSIAMTCALIDTVLIIMGSLGLGYIINKHPVIEKSALIFGIIFLVFYGFKSFYNATKSHELRASGENLQSVKQAVLVAVAFSLLNPHVYLDTVVLLGSIGSVYEDKAKLVFTFGACLASWLWFYSLAMGARGLSSFFANPKSWKYLDILIGVIMWLIAWKLYSLAK